MVEREFVDEQSHAGILRRQNGNGAGATNTACESVETRLQGKVDVGQKVADGSDVVASCLGNGISRQCRYGNRCILL